MLDNVRNTCSYIDAHGQCCNFQGGNNGLCYWHDPEQIKTGQEFRQLLEKCAQNGLSMAGFKLANADLTGINLTYPGQKKGANLSGADLYRANLKGAQLFAADFTGASLMNADLSYAELKCAHLENANLLGVNLNNSLMELITWGDKVKQEELAFAAHKSGNHQLAMEYFQQAEEIYRNLRKECDIHGLNDQAGYFFYREMTVRRLQLPFWSSNRWISKLVDIFCGYGEKPLRVMATSFFSITFFALLYALFGIDESGLIYSTQDRLDFDLFISNFFTCFYFSTVTFTTLGYGDISPVGFSRLIAAIDAFLGSFSIALFVVVFVKRMTR